MSTVLLLANIAALIVIALEYRSLTREQRRLRAASAIVRTMLPVKGDGPWRSTQGRHAA